MRVLAALSGGVDSAVAAARAADAGHDVTAVHLALSRNAERFRSGARGCCSLEDSRDAARVADRLGLPYYVWDLSEQFSADVVDNFVEEYGAGRTPNPCVRCNEHIKFTAVLQKALALGFDAVCTGHYAQLVPTADGVELHRAVDSSKDQSYVLAVLGPDKLARAMFPLGATHKLAVRAEAVERGLLVADKPDSHDICFIPDGDTKKFLTDRLGTRPGKIVDANGSRVGEHGGAYAFTVGQRKGLGLSVATPDRSPRYVLSVEPVGNTVTVGTHADLAVDRLSATPVTWCGASASSTFSAKVQVRAHGEALLGLVEPKTNTGEGSVSVALELPHSGVAAGQTLVMYAGTRVVGSATIVAAWKADA